MVKRKNRAYLQHNYERLAQKAIKCKTHPFNAWLKNNNNQRQTLGWLYQLYLIQQ